jgi:capsid protein
MVIKGMVSTLVENVLGVVGGKCQLHTEDKDFNQAALQIMRDYFSDCSYLEDNKNLNELLKVIYSAVITDGDILLYQSRATDGKLICYEADSIVQIDKAIFAGKALELGYFDELDELDMLGQPKKAFWVQRQGAIVNRLGKVVKWVVTGDSNKATHNFEDCIVLDAKDCRLFANKTRPNQVRGLPILLGLADTSDDLNSIVKSECQTMKKLSRMGVVISQNDLEAANEADIASQGIDITTASEDILNTLSSQKPHKYESLERNCGGETYYVNNKDKIEPFQFNRPNMNLAEFCNWVNRSIGKSLGLYNLYSSGEATSSYAGGRLESMLTWNHFVSEQKKIEREILDMVTIKVIEIAIQTKRLKLCSDANWKYKISFSFPVLGQINQLVEANANLTNLKAGLTTYSELLGSDYLAKLQKVADETAMLKEMGLEHLSVFETKSGTNALQDTVLTQAIDASGE